MRSDELAHLRFVRDIPASIRGHHQLIDKLALVNSITG